MDRLPPAALTVSCTGISTNDAFGSFVVPQSLEGQRQLLVAAQQLALREVQPELANADLHGNQW